MKTVMMYEAAGEVSDVEPRAIFTVTGDAMRPASSNCECFYCQQRIGAQHKPDCVLINKRVKIRMIVEYEAEVPASWGKEEIEFSRNEGSWCANNALYELECAFGQDDGPCMCSVASFEYLGGDSEPYLNERS